jgi:hypothetical protein
MHRDNMKSIVSPEKSSRIFCFFAYVRPGRSRRPCPAHSSDDHTVQRMPATCGEDFRAASQVFASPNALPIHDLVFLAATSAVILHAVDFLLIASDSRIMGMHRRNYCCSFLFRRSQWRMSGQNSFVSLDTPSHMICVPQMVKVFEKLRSCAGR